MGPTNGMRTNLTIGIAGARSIGRVHGLALRALADDGAPVEVTTYSGGAPGSGEAMGWPNAQQVSHEELLGAPVDLVVLCSPTDLHADQALRVARSGRHVVVEKPIALSPTESAALVRAQEHGPGIIAMISQRRYEFPYPQVKALLDSGDLGVPRMFVAEAPWFRDEPYFDDAPWRRSHGSGGGSLVNQGVHTVDLLQWFAGPVTSIAAVVTSQMGLADVDDTVAASLGFASGALGSLVTSTATPPGFDATLSVYTTRGRVVLGQGEVVAWEIDGIPAPTGDKGPASGAQNPLDIGTQGHQEAWRAILAAIEVGEPAPVDAREGHKVTQIIHGVYEASRTGRTISPS